MVRRAFSSLDRYASIYACRFAMRADWDGEGERENLEARWVARLSRDCLGVVGRLLLLSGMDERGERVDGMVRLNLSHFSLPVLSAMALQAICHALSFAALSVS